MYYLEGKSILYLGKAGIAWGIIGYSTNTMVFLNSGHECFLSDVLGYAIESVIW